MKFFSGPRRIVTALTLTLTATAGVAVATWSSPEPALAHDRVAGAPPHHCPEGVWLHVTVQEKRQLRLGRTNRAAWVPRRNPTTGHWMRGRDRDRTWRANYRLHVRNRDWGPVSFFEHVVLGRMNKDRWIPSYGPYSTIRINCHTGNRHYLP